MPGKLQATHQKKLDQIAQVKARCRRVKTAVVGDGRTGQQFRQLISVRRDVDEAAPLKFLPEVRKRSIVGLHIQRSLGVCGRHIGHSVRLPARDAGFRQALVPDRH